VKLQVQFQQLVIYKLVKLQSIQLIKKIYARSSTGIVEVANAAASTGASVDDATALAIALG